MRTIFVKRGEFWTFKVLEERCGAIQDVDVRWDRRRGEDRRQRSAFTPRERRSGDRRKPLPADWAIMGYTVVELTDPDSSRGPVER